MNTSAKLYHEILRNNQVKQLFNFKNWFKTSNKFRRIQLQSKVTQADPYSNVN